MASRSPSLEPAVIIVHSDPERAVILDEMVMIALDVCATLFIDPRLISQWRSMKRFRGVMPKKISSRNIIRIQVERMN
jgi:hypothetical protein